MTGMLEALSRLLRRTRGKHHRPMRWRRQAMTERAERDMAWLGEILPATSPPEQGSEEPSPPHISRYARLTWPQPDDTVFDLPRIPGQFQPSAGTFRGALGRPRWSH